MSRCTAGGARRVWDLQIDALTAPVASRKRNSVSTATSAALFSQCCPHSISTAVFGLAGSPKAAALDHAQAGRVAGVDQQVGRHADPAREGGALLAPCAQTMIGRQGSCIECRSSRKSAASTNGRSSRARRSSARVARPEQRIVAPDAVVVLVDVARAVRVVEIEARVGGDVGERQRQLACSPALFPRRTTAFKRNRAAELVAVRERLHHHVRPGLAGIEHVHVVRRRCCRSCRAQCPAARVQSGVFKSKLLYFRQERLTRFFCKAAKPAVFCSVCLVHVQALVDLDLQAVAAAPSGPSRRAPAPRPCTGR